MDYVYIAIGAVSYGAMEWFTGLTAKLKALVGQKPQDGPPPAPPPKT